MALSLLCGGLGVASASLEVVDQSGTAGTVTIYTKDEVDKALDTKGAATDVETNKAAIADLKNAVGAAGSGLTKEVADQKAAITANTKSIDTNKAAIESLRDDKLGKDLANSTFATKDALNDLTTTVHNKVDESVVEAALDNKADKTYVDTKLADYAKSDDVYTKTAADGKFATSAALDTAKTDLEGKITTAKNELDGKITANTQKIGANETAITDLKDADVRLEGKINQNTNDITGLKDKDMELSGKIDNNKNLIDQNAANITQNKNDIAAIGGRLTTAEGNIQTNADAINALDTKVGTINNGNYLDGTKSVGENLNALDAQTKTNTDEIARVNQELVNTNNHFNTELGKTNTALNKEVQERVDADTKLTGRIDATDKRTAGIKRTDTGVEEDNQTVIEGKVHFDQNGNVSDVKDLSAETITTTGNAAIGGALGVTGATTLNGALTANGEATFKDKVTVEKDLAVNGKLNVGEISMKNVELDAATGNKHDSATSITADGISNIASIENGGTTTKSQFSHNEKGTFNSASKGDSTDWKEATSNVTADGVENIAKDSKGNNNTFTQTSTDTKNTLTDKEGNTSTTRQDSKGVYGYAKDKDGNKSYTKQEGNRIAESVIGQDGKQTKSEMTSTDITNTAKDGTITNTAKNVTNEGTESVTNKVGNNEVKVSTDSVDIKADKKITESVGTASRVVENDKITDKASDSTVTTENGKGTTFGKAGSAGTTNIYGDSIKTGTINANDTTTAKLTAGAAAGADGGRLTVDANDGVKGSYKSGKYISRSYILDNTLKSGVDNDKKPTEDGFAGSRTDHYMDGDNAKLDETVKDAAGSNVTNKTSTSTATTITDGDTTTKTEQGVKDITNTATDGTIKNDAKVITNKASEVINNEAVNINNTATGIITSKASEIKNQADKLISNKVGENTWENMENGKITTSIKDGAKQNLTQSDAEKTEHSVVNGSNSTVNKQTSEEITDAVTNGTTTNVTQNTATSSNNTIADTNGNANTVVSTVDGTKFTNTGANTAIGEGTVTDTTIKGNTITTGKVTMDYAEVMKDLGVRGKTTTGSLEVTGASTLTGDVTMGSNATVKGNFNVEGNTNLKNTKVDGTLNVTQKATFDDSVSIAKDLSVDGNATIKGDVTANSYKVGDKTYISAAGINANDQRITNVADGSISEGSKDAVNGGQLYNVKNDLEGKVNKVGANAAAMANLHPMEFDPDSKWNIAAAIGNYGSETAAALGAFYRPNDDVMVNLSTAFGTGENMVGGGVSVRLGKGGNKLSREESNALKAQVDDLTARMDALLSVLNLNMSKDFPDVPENHWAYEAVSRLAGNDIVQGYPDGEFHGERTMTRYEMAEIIYNALSRGAEAEKELVEEFKPELQAMAASEKATAEKAEG